MNATRTVYCLHVFILFVIVTIDLRPMVETQETECQGNFFGLQCKSSCNLTCSESKCNSRTGKCSDGCVAGYKGPYCEKACSPGTYGMNCATSCDNCDARDCDHVDGKCLKGCKEGYQPPYCLERCPLGKLGRNCCFRCKNDTCHLRTGNCEQGCKEPGYMPPQCQNPCTEGSYGMDCKSECPTHCLNGLCDHMHGACQECEPGWQGPYCDSYCDEGTFGASCAQTCDPACQGKGCHIITGECNKCSAGLTGDDCETHCSENHFGPDCHIPCDEHCESKKGRRLCDAKTGHCLHGCTDYLVPPLCRDCMEHSYGYRCEFNCNSVCRVGCDKGNGTCVWCPAGYQGNTCSTKCNTKTYGENCREICSEFCLLSICHHVSGACANCIPGRKGPFCEVLRPHKLQSDHVLSAWEEMFFILGLIILGGFFFLSTVMFTRKHGSTSTLKAPEDATTLQAKSSSSIDADAVASKKSSKTSPANTESDSSGNSDSV